MPLQVLCLQFFVPENFILEIFFFADRIQPALCKVYPAEIFLYTSFYKQESF